MICPIINGIGMSDMGQETVRVALGFKAHSGWAAMVAIGMTESYFHVVDRRRVELIDEGEEWAKQPYHAAEDLEPDSSRSVVQLGIESAHRVAIRQMSETVSRISKLGHEIAGCAVLVPSPMPDWSTAEILAVHFRMHKAEGVLFPDALCRAAKTCGLSLASIPEKQLAEHSEAILSVPYERTMDMILKIGKLVGPPWGRDQKNAALAAIIALQMVFE